MMDSERRSAAPVHSVSLVDILDRVLDKGLVVAGDIRISLANVELLTIRIRLLVCSIDKAAEIGLDWWRHDPFLSTGAERAATELTALQARVAALEALLSAQPERPSSPPTPRSPSRRQPRTGR